MADILKRKKQLKDRLKKITAFESEQEISIRNIFGRGIQGLKKKYDIGKFGFSYGQFVLLSSENDKIALCVGVGIDIDSEIKREEQLWFFIEGKNEIRYWGGYRTDDFLKNGIILLP